MATEIRGALKRPAKKIACVVSRFNEEITQSLLKGSLEAFEAAGLSESQLDVVWVPGAFEIPIALKNVLLTNNYSGVVVLSTVIKGDTDHDQYVASVLTQGISRLSLEANIPVTYGVITSKNWRQAEERAGGKYGNRGSHAAEACLEMIDCVEKVRQ